MYTSTLAIELYVVILEDKYMAINKPALGAATLVSSYDSHGLT